MYQISGIVESITVGGEATGKTLEIQGISTEVGSNSLGRLMRNTMRVFTGAVIAFHSLLSRKLVITDDATAAATAAAAAAAGATGTGTLRAKAGQSGTSLEFEVVGEPSGVVGQAFDTILAPIVPKYSVDGLVSALARELPDGFHPIVQVNQETAEVKVYLQPTANGETKDNAIAAAVAGQTSANKVSLELEAIEVGSGNTDLPFEGGEV